MKIRETNRMISGFKPIMGKKSFEYLNTGPRERSPRSIINNIEEVKV
jgi:hypothetical protein